MRKISLFACTLILASPVISPIILPSSALAVTKEKENAMGTVTPSEDSKALASKQLEAKLNELKDALEGMHSAMTKGDRASFILYRSAAKSALTEIEKVGQLQVGSETSGEHKALKEGKMQPPNATPTATPTPEATPTPTPTPTPEATPTASPTPTP